jgi:hypothetical protein
MATAGDRWAFWLETQLEDKGWKPADLVRASGLKANGRPVIDAPRVSAWLKGDRPSFDLASAAGTALGLGSSTALVAAGYAVEVDSGASPARVFSYTAEGKDARDVGPDVDAEPYAARGPRLVDASLDELLGEIARRARDQNPEA